MKTISFISLLVGTLFLASCSEMETPITTEIVVIYDITDSLLSEPDADEIISRFGLNANTSNGAEFRFVMISDVSYTRIESAHLEPVTDKWSSNDFQRGKIIQKFEEKIRNILTNAMQDSVGKKYSSVYVPLATHLNQLSKSTSENRILFVYSDLMEHQKEISFYDKKTFNLLKHDPEKIETQLDSQMPLGRLDGIDIHFLYQPLNAEQDNQYRVVSEFYKNLFEEFGASVIIGANLTE